MNLLLNVKRKIQKLIWQFFWHNFQLPQIDIEDIADGYRQELPRIRDEICLPPYKGDTNLNDFSFLISLIKELKPLTVVELGTGFGNTVANICAVSEAKIYTVNALPEQIAGNVLTYTLTKEEIGSVYRQYGLEDRVVQIYENTKKLNILQWVAPKSVDFALIDACHDADFVVNDFLKIYPSLSDQAIVLIHDTNPSLENQLLDSYIGCMYLRKIGFNVKHLKNSSWAFWSVNDPRYEQLLIERIENAIHTTGGILLFGSQEKFIRMIRWLASGFLRNKFTPPVSI